MYRRFLLLLIACACMPLVWAQSAVHPPLPDSNFIHRRGGLQNTYNGLAHQAPGHLFTVAYLGGSITNMNGWRNLVDSFLRKQFPQTTLRFINAGIPSLGSLPHAFRLQRDVLDSGRIDLLFVEAAVNDHVNGTDSLTQMRTLEGIVRHARKANPYMDIVLMSFADPDKLKDYDYGKTPVEITNHELIATHYNLSSINLAQAVHDRIANGEFSWEKDFKDLHPAPFGHQLYFNAIRRLLLNTPATPQNAADLAFRRHPLPAPLNHSAFANGRYLALSEARTDTAWTLHPDWTPSDGLNTRKGFVHVPMLTATTPGASLTLPFKGTAIGIAVVSGKDAGSLEYSIDGSPFKPIDLYAQWSKSLHLPWYVLFDGNLARKKHTLTLRVANARNAASTGHACRIVHFLVND